MQSLEGRFDAASPQRAPRAGPAGASAEAPSASRAGTNPAAPGLIAKGSLPREARADAMRNSGFCRGPSARAFTTASWHCSTASSHLRGRYPIRAPCHSCPSPRISTGHPRQRTSKASMVMSSSPRDHQRTDRASITAPASPGEKGSLTCATSHRAGRR